MTRRRDPLRDPERLIRRVYAYVAYRIGPGPDAEDVTSETFERALRYREAYDPSRAEPIAWLIGIARRCIAELYAAPERRLVSARAHEGHEEVIVRRLELADALAQLPECDRELIALRYVADLSSRDIGALLGMRANAVDVALHRARGRLRTALAPDGKPVSGVADAGAHAA